MFVDSMSSEELVAEFLKDEQNVNRKLEYLVKEVRKKAIRTRNKQYKKIFEYKSPLKNEWLILVDYNNCVPLILPMVHYLNGGKLNALTKQPESNNLTHYTSHFLDRYNERFLKQEGLSAVDILKLFIPINSICTYDFYSASINNGNRVFARFKDGVGLGVFEQPSKYTLVFLRTYISSDMIGDWQQGEFNSISMDFEKHWEEANEKLFR
jgi:hypothetical protein